MPSGEELIGSLEYVRVFMTIIFFLEFKSRSGL
jgi:hypothetical protein